MFARNTSVAALVGTGSRILPAAFFGTEAARVGKSRYYGALRLRED